MKRCDALDPKTLETIKRRLTARLHELKRSLTEHERSTTELLPPNLRESAAAQGDLHVLEAEEKLEAGEIGLIEGALQRIARGTYGGCRSCRKAISKTRLLAVPETSFCRACKKNCEEKSSGQCWTY